MHNKKVKKREKKHYLNKKKIIMEKDDHALPNACNGRFITLYIDKCDNY